ncbi:MAG: hypothetical protein Q4B12_09435 [Bowdeniella nasicola]|nr:hypothetical protein [Bowdeniella nasicola]
MRTALFPLSFRWLAALTGILALVCAVVSWWLIPTWANPELRVVLPFLREQLILPAVVLGVAAAILFNPHNKSCASFGPATSLSAWQRCRPALVTLWVSAVVGPLLGWSYPLIRGAMAGFRLVDLVPLLALLAALLALASLAALFANLLPRIWTVVLTPVLCALVIVAPVALDNLLLSDSGFSVFSLAFMRGFRLISFPTDAVLSVEVLRLLYFLLLAVCATIATTHANMFSLTARRPSLLRAAAFLVPPVAVFAASAAVSPVLVGPYTGPTTCDVAGNHKVCLPSAQAHMLPGLTAHVATFVEQLPPGWVPDDETVAFSPGNSTYFSLPDPSDVASQQEWEEIYFASLAQGALPLHDPTNDACLSNSFTGDVANALLLRSGVPVAPVHALNETTGESITIVPRADDSPALAFLTGLSNEEFHGWLTANREALATCTLSEEAFE